MNFDLSEFLKYFKSLFSVAFAVLIVGIILLIFEDFLGKFLGIEELLKNYKGILGAMVIFSFLIILALSIDKVKLVFTRYFKARKNRAYYYKKLIELTIDEKAFVFRYLLIDNYLIEVDELDFFTNKKYSMIRAQLLVKQVISAAATKASYTVYMLNEECWEIIQEKPKEIFYEDEFKKYFIEEKES